ncbi:MAG: GNAT family N-acetyltransferase [Micropepsaceae bacterium]
MTNPSWRPMTRADLPAVERIGEIVHPAFPEDPAIAAERLALEPTGCFIFDVDSKPSAYFLSHRWVDGAPPALDSHLHALPAHPDVWYIHDIALLSETRGQGAARTIIATLEALARSHGLHRLALVAVNNSVPFWHRHGFTDATTPALATMLASYGGDARYMTRDLLPL